jgi:hypothetical protein
MFNITKRGAEEFPHLRVHSLSRGGSMSHCRYPADRVPLHTSLKSRQVARRASTHCHMPYGSDASRPYVPIKKSLAVLLVQLGTHLPNARAQVSNASDRARKTCGKVAQSMPIRRADRQLQCYYSTAPALWITYLTPLQCQATRQHSVTLLTECSVAGDKTSHAHTVEDIICYSYPLEPYCIEFYLPEATCRVLGLIITI